MGTDTLHQTQIRARRQPQSALLSLLLRHRRPWLLPALATESPGEAGGAVLCHQQDPCPSAPSIPPTRDRGERGAPGTKLSSFTSRMNHARCKHPAELLLASVTKNTLRRALCFAARGSLAPACPWLYPCSCLAAGLAVCPVPGRQPREAALQVAVARGRRRGRRAWQRRSPRQAEDKAVCLRSWKI